MEVTKAGGPYYNCCAARLEENWKWNFHKKKLPNLETELMTHSVILWISLIFEVPWWFGINIRFRANVTTIPA